MKLVANYIIPRAFNLPWEQVSPTDTNGLDFHLTPNLTIRIEEIARGRNEFVVASKVLESDGYEEKQLANIAEVEAIFQKEYLPGKTQERVNKFFKEGNMTCFFKEKQIQYLNNRFDELGYTASRVSVIFNGKKVDDIAELPPKEFKLVMEEFKSLEVERTIPMKDNHDELEAAYDHYFEKRVASAEKHTKQTLWDKLKGKGAKKKLAIALGSTTLGVLGYIGRRTLLQIGGVYGVLGAMVAGVAGIILDMYGRQELSSLMSSTLTTRFERGFFS